jgi:2-hydroxy-3-oxopropionate reductase
MIKVGFIGLGEQGKPMAVNLAKDGFDLIVNDLRREPVDELIAIGAKSANSPREAAADNEIIEIAVVDDAQVEAVVMGEDGIIAGARQGSVIAIHRSSDAARYSKPPPKASSMSGRWAAG